jgi:methionyl-tRNA formyltransferase
VRLSELGALALIEALTLLSIDQVQELPQDASKATFAPKVTREDARIDWTHGAMDVSRAIRAYDPKPGAFTTREGLEVKLYGARIARDASGDPGEVLAIDESGMLVACGEGSGGVRVAYVHPAGRRRVAALDWAQGRGVSVDDRLGN